MVVGTIADSHVPELSQVNNVIQEEVIDSVYEFVETDQELQSTRFGINYREKTKY
jgi:hypothetical protein